MSVTESGYVISMAEEQLQVSRHQHPEGLVLTVIGDVDLYTASTLTESAVSALDELTTHSAGNSGSPALRLVIDLQAVPFMDSAGLGVLVGVLRRARSEGLVMLVVAPQDPIMRLMQVTGLAAVMPIRDDVHAALTDDEPGRSRVS